MSGREGAETTALAGEDPDQGARWEESDLLDALLRGEEAAFDHLSAEYFPKVYRFVLKRLGDPELTRDVVQTALGKAMHRLASFRRESSLLTWLCACANNEVRMHLRREARNPQLDVSDERLSVAVERSSQRQDLVWGPRPVSPEGGYFRSERAQLVHDALDRLPEKSATALQMKYLEALPVADVAAALDLTPKAAESLLTRSREAFRREFEKLQSSPLVGQPGAQENGS